MDVVPDEVRRERIATLERAFDVRLSTEEMSTLLAAKVGAVPGGPSLRAGALGAVREAFRELYRVDRESIDESTPLARFLFGLGAGGSKQWKLLSCELRCRLPPFPFASGRRPWALALVIGAQIWVLSSYTKWIVGLVLLATLGVVTLLLSLRSMRLPARMATVEQLVTWLVAHAPSNYRTGTEWTTGQVEEVVDAVHRLRFERPGFAELLQHLIFVALLVALAVTSLTLCVLGFRTIG